MKDEELVAEIQSLHAKLDRVLAILESNQHKKPAPSERAPLKPKASALTENEIKDFQNRFGALFVRWLEGHELEVQDDLEKLDVEQLRRFADANNLNVTSKMPKQRVLLLIGARFREKRQLQRGPQHRGEGAAQPGNAADERASPARS